MSQLIYPADWLAFCRGSPLAGSDLHGNLNFFIFYKPGSFFINALCLTNTLYSGMKNKLSLGFSDTKRMKRTGLLACVAGVNRGRGYGGRCVIDLCGYFIGHFSGIFRIRSSSISAYSWRLKNNRLLNPKNRLWYIPCLFIIVPPQEGEQSISLRMKRIRSI